MKLLKSLAMTAATAAVVAAASPSWAENVIRWSRAGDALTADPHAANAAPTLNSAHLVYDSLFFLNNEMKIVPWLATGFDLKNATTWDFSIREGVKFHDGSILTTQDVKFSLERALSENSDVKGDIAAISGVEVLDDTTVRVTTNGPSPILPNLLANIMIMSESWATEHGVELPQDRSGGEETFAVRNAMGTGPFILESREPDLKTVMVKNPDWWGLSDNPHDVDKLVFTPIANQATRIAALLSGELDFVIDPPVQDLARIEKTSGYGLQTAPQIRTIFLGMNQYDDELGSSNVEGANPFKDVRVRKAMYQAINIEAIQEKIMRGFSVPAGMIQPPGVHGYSEKLDARFDYDLDAAKALMAEAGYADGFSIQLDCPNDRYINDEAICQAVVGMLAKIGVDVNLSAITKSQHFPLIGNRETDFYMLGWGNSSLDSYVPLKFQLHSEDSGWNAGGYSNPRMDELVNSIETETDFTKRDAMIEEAWQISVDDVVYLPLHHQVIAWAMSDKVSIPIAGDNFVRFHNATFK